MTDSKEARNIDEQYKHATPAPKSKTVRIAKRVVAATLGSLLGVYVAALNTPPKIAPPARPAIPSTNGFNLLKAATAQTFLDDDVNDAIQKKPQKVRTLQEKQALVDANHVPLEKTKEALRYPYLAEVNEAESLRKTPHYARFRQMARLSVLAGNVAWEKGDQKKATEYHLNGITIGRRVPHNVGLIGDLVGIASECIARAPLWKRVDQMDEATAQGVLAKLEQLEHERLPYSQTLEQEKYQMLEGINKTMQHPETFQEVLGTDPNESRRLGLYARFVPRKYVIGTMSTYTDTLITQANKPYITDHQEPALPNEIFTRIMMPVFTKVRCKHVANETGDALLRTALALRVYQVQNGKYPDTLSELVKTKIIAQVPDDPFALPGTPVRYSKEGVKYTLYSIGPDGIDNKGETVKNKGTDATGGANRAVFSDSNGDIVAGWYSY